MADATFVGRFAGEPRTVQISQRLRGDGPVADHPVTVIVKGDVPAWEVQHILLCLADRVNPLNEGRPGESEQAA